MTVLDSIRAEFPQEPSRRSKVGWEIHHSETEERRIGWHVVVFASASVPNAERAHVVDRALRMRN